jgi:hypothetical protein
MRIDQIPKLYRLYVNAPTGGQDVLAGVEQSTDGYCLLWRADRKIQAQAFGRRAVTVAVTTITAVPISASRNCFRFSAIGRSVINHVSTLKRLAEFLLELCWTELDGVALKWTSFSKKDSTHEALISHRLLILTAGICPSLTASDSLWRQM